jgi:hypothetical protein
VHELVNKTARTTAMQCVLCVQLLLLLIGAAAAAAAASAVTADQDHCGKCLRVNLCVRVCVFTECAT